MFIVVVDVVVVIIYCCLFDCERGKRCVFFFVFGLLLFCGVYPKRN